MADSTTPSGPGPTSKPATPSPSDAAKEARLLPLHLVDLGTKKSKLVQDLKKGRGRLVDDVAETIMDVEAKLDEAAENVLPVVMIVERKRKRRSAFLA